MEDNLDSVVRQFEEIELRVEDLITFCKQLKLTNLELNKKIDELEKELQIKNVEESRYLEERKVISSKVNDVLSKLDDITEG